MPDSLPPVAIRVARPYATEEELLERELETLTRTSVTLIGAQPRPQGVVLRFELVLSAGQVLMRGEGRVVGYKQGTHDGLGGLTLRFTRLDTRSKAVVDRAAALRDRRRPSAAAPPTAEVPLVIASLPPLPVVETIAEGDVTHADRGSSEEVEPLSSGTVLPSSERFADSEPSFVEAPPIVSVAEREPVAETAYATETAARSEGALVAETNTPESAPRVQPQNRDALLERLRVRSRSLPEDALQKLLERRRD